MNFACQMKSFAARSIFCFLCLSVTVFPQTRSNLDLFFQLADSVSSGIREDFKNDIPSAIEFVGGTEYRVFENSIIGKLNQSGASTKNKEQLLRITITDASVTYSEVERGSLFGSFTVQRMVSLHGNYLIPKGTTGVKQFAYSLVEKIPYESLQSVENSSYPFTEGKIPQEPFFASLVEPVIALGTAAAAVYIFFTARSK